MLHALILGSLVVSLAITGLAVTDMKNHRDPFMPLIASGSGGFFSLVIATQWITQLFLSPCTS
jgi:hypothetical protein